jgi:two-component system OmpR family response regulator
MFDANGPKILIVEDDPSVRDLLTTRLELAGYRTRCANDGADGLKLAASYRPDAMVLDINMPRLDGFGVLSALAKRPGASLPVLVLTARNAEDDVRRCLHLGAKDYLAKPFDERQLLARVSRLLRRPRPAVALDA